MGVEGVGEAVGGDFCDAGVGDFGGGSLAGRVGFEDEVFGWAFVFSVVLVGGWGEVLGGVEARGFEMVAVLGSASVLGRFGAVARRV